MGNSKKSREDILALEKVENLPKVARNYKKLPVLGNKQPRIEKKTSYQKLN